MNKPPDFRLSTFGFRNRPPTGRRFRKSKAESRKSLIATAFIVILAAAPATVRAGDADATASGAVRPALPPLALPKMPDGFHRRVVAEVGGRPVLLSEVFEQFGPVWEELADQVRRGRISPEDFERELKMEWDKSLQASLREELFYHEARFTFDRMFDRLVEQLERQTGNSVPRSAHESRVRRELEGELRKQLDRLVADAQRRAGGPAALQRSLARRGVNVTDWNERLKRKAFVGFLCSLRSKPSLRSPTPQRIRDYYARHKDGEFRRPGRAIFRHIYFGNRERGGAEAAQAAAVACWQRLTAGELSFADAAAQYSDDPVSREKGGLDTGQADATRPEREVWLRAVRGAVRDEAPGELSGILESDFGSHLTVLLEIMPSVPAPFDEVREEIVDRIISDDQRREVDELYAKLAREVPVRVVMNDFPPECGWESIGRDARPGERPTLRRVY